MALCTGNTLVLKAAEDAPLGVLRMAEVCAQHLPAGVLNVRHGLRRGVRRPAAQPPRDRQDHLHRLHRGRPDRDARRGRAHPAGVAGARRQGAGDRLPRLRRRRHGRARHHAMRFARQGQSCTAGSRLYVHAAIFDDFTARLADSARRAGRRRRARRALGHRLDRLLARRTRASARTCARRSTRARALTGGLPDDARPGYQLQPDRAHRRRAVLARQRARRSSAPCSSRCPGSDEDQVIALGQRHPLRPGRVRVLARTSTAPCAPRTGSRPAGSRSTAAAASCPGMSYGGKKLSGLGSEYSIEGALESFTQRKSITIGIGGRRADISIPWASEPSGNASSRSRPRPSPAPPRTSNGLPRGASAHRGDGRERPVLYAGTNAMTGAVPPPRCPARRTSESGHPAEKSSRTEQLEVLEVLTTRPCGDDARSLRDVRVQSATLANLAVYAAYAGRPRSPPCRGGRRSLQPPPRRRRRDPRPSHRRTALRRRRTRRPRRRASGLPPPRAACPGRYSAAR